MSDLPASPTPPPVELTLAPPLPEPLPVGSVPATRFAVRLWCVFAFTLCAVMLGIGLKLNPSPEGTGTHEQMGLPPCGMLSATGYPCPTCGCTTAVSNFAHGHIIRSFLTQPFGFYVALLAALLLPLTLWGAVTGKWIGPSMFWLGWHWQYWVYGSIGILLVGWLYKVIIIRMQIAI